jgi:hypothetical protein
MCSVLHMHANVTMSDGRYLVVRPDGQTRPEISANASLKMDKKISQLALPNTSNVWSLFSRTVRCCVTPDLTKLVTKMLQCY